MAVLLPCLLMAALGVIFGAVHMLYGKSASKDGDDAGGQHFVCTGACGACGFGCAAQKRDDADAGREEGGAAQ